MNHDITDAGDIDNAGMNLLTASLYGLGSVWSAIAVINNPEPSEGIMHLVVRLMTSIMIGQLIEAGKIKESDYFIDYFPEYKNGTAFDRVTVESLLDMQSGVGVSDNYPTGPQGWGVAIAQMYATTDLNWFIGNNRKMFFEPGSNAEYRSVDTQMLVIS